MSAAPCQDHRRHAVAAAEVENAQPGHVAECREGRTNPGLVIEVGIIGKNEPARVALEGQSALPGLVVVKDLFAVKAVHRVPASSFPSSAWERTSWKLCFLLVSWPRSDISGS